MPLQKNIVTPAGNVLGTFGIVTQVVSTTDDKGITAVSCAVTLYASPDAEKAAKPAVAFYRYPLGVAVPDGSTKAQITALAETALLKSEDAGPFLPAGSQQGGPNVRPWVPGWSGATIVPAS